MRKGIITAILFLSMLAVYAQNGLNNGHLFLLLKDKETISLNAFESNKINEIQTFSITEKSIYTTDQKSRVAVLDTSKNILSLFDINTKTKTELKIPFVLKPKALLLNNENLFIGGEMGNEMLMQYNLQNKEWYKLQIPTEVQFFGKAIDDLVVNDSFLLAIDNIITPKYGLFYQLNANGELNLSHFKKLKSNGTYESIHHGRITKKYLGLISGTVSGYVGLAHHITVYKNLGLTSSFSISSYQNEKDFQTFTDILIVKDKVVIASKEKGLGILEIKSDYFSNIDENLNDDFNARVSTSNIKYRGNNKHPIIKLTPIPNTDKIIITFRNNQRKITHQVIDL